MMGKFALLVLIMLIVTATVLIVTPNLILCKKGGCKIIRVAQKLVVFSSLPQLCHLQ